VALDQIFYNFAAIMDSVVINGMNDAIRSGLTWVAPQLRVAVGLYVIGNALAMMYGKMDAGGFLYAVVRAMAVIAILKLAAYEYYVRDLFFTDLPNGIAAALNGPRVTVDSSKQFDQLWGAVVHAQAFISGQSMGVAGPFNRLFLWVLAMLDLGALGACFFIWYASRVLMALAIAIGPFIIPLYLFRGTREYVNQWIGKIVNLIVLQLGTSILMRFVILVLSETMRSLNNSQVAVGGNVSVDTMMINFAGVTGIFFLAAMMMLVLPIFLTIGSGSSGAISAVSGMALKAGSAVGGAATGASAATVKGAATLGRRLGQYTGSR
jgi:type IV secretion system protein VirB6